MLLIYLTHKFGYGKWSTIKRELRLDCRARFDHLLISRNEQELSKRVEILVKTLEKEEEDTHKNMKKHEPMMLEEVSYSEEEEEESKVMQIDEAESSRKSESMSEDARLLLNTMDKRRAEQE